MIKEKVIIDGDWGGDEMQLATVLLGNPDQVEVLGATCTFGNVSHSNVYENAKRILHFLKADRIPLFKGATAPTGRDEPLLGDGAHPVLSFLPEPEHRQEQEDSAVDFILKTLSENQAGTITITASGPLTNIAEAFRQDPQTMHKAKNIVIMGGCTKAMAASDMPERRGNITPFAEFNFQQSATDAKTVMESGLPMTLLPMNCTHQLTMTPERQKQLVSQYRNKSDIRRALIGTTAIQNGDIAPEDAEQMERGLMNGPAHLDREKFDIDSVMHDIHCALYILHPEEYETQQGQVSVRQHTSELTSDTMWDSDQGQTDFTADAESTLRVATGIKNADTLFDVFTESLARINPPLNRGMQRI